MATTSSSTKVPPLPPKEGNAPKRKVGRPSNDELAQRATSTSAQAPAPPAAEKQPADFPKLDQVEADRALDDIFNGGLAEIGDEWRLSPEERSGPSKRLAAAINDWAQRSAVGKSAAEILRRLNLVLLVIALTSIVVRRAARTFKRWRAEKRAELEKTGKVPPSSSTSTPAPALRAVGGGDAP